MRTVSPVKPRAAPVAAPATDEWEEF
jgi:hypothetical protein